MKVRTLALAELFYTIDTYGTFSTDLLDDDWFEESEFNHSLFLRDLADTHAEIIRNCLPSGGINNVEVVSVGSPMYYNFSTDWCELEIDVDLDKLREYLEFGVSQEFDQFLHDKFTSRDGFMSYTPNNIMDFNEVLDKVSDEYNRDVDFDKCVGILAGWYLTRECLTEDEYLDEMYNSVHELMWNNFEQFTEETWKEFTKYEDEFNRLKETQLEFKGFPPGQMYPLEITEWYTEVYKKEEDDEDTTE